MDEKESRHTDVIKETVDSLFDNGLITKENYEKFLALCSCSEHLPYIPSTVHTLTSEEINLLRVREKLTRADLAVYLDTSVNTIERWERGLSTPSDAQMKLLNIIRNKGIKGIA